MPRDLLSVDLRELRRAGARLVLRGLATVAGYALAGLVLFVLAALVTELALVDGGWIRLLYVPYVVLGAVVGANLGLGAVLRRESGRLVHRSSDVLSPLVERLVDRLRIPEEGMQVDRLRALVELEWAGSRFESRAGRALAGFAISSAVERAGLRAVRDQLLRAVSEAEVRGDTVVSREDVRTAARNGIGAAFADQVDAVWGARQGLARVVALLALASLPILAIVAG